MEIKELKDLEILKNALENYIKNSDESVEVMKKSNMPQSMVEGFEKNFERSKELLDEVTKEFYGTVDNKVKEKFKNGDVVEVIFTENE